MLKFLLVKKIHKSKKAVLKSKNFKTAFFSILIHVLLIPGAHHKH